MQHAPRRNAQHGRGVPERRPLAALRQGSVRVALPRPGCGRRSSRTPAETDAAATLAAAGELRATDDRVISRKKGPAAEPERLCVDRDGPPHHLTSVAPGAPPVEPPQRRIEPGSCCPAVTRLATCEASPSSWPPCWPRSASASAPASAPRRPRSRPSTARPVPSSPPRSRRGPPSPPRPRAGSGGSSATRLAAPPGS